MIFTYSIFGVTSINEVDHDYVVSQAEGKVYRLDDLVRMEKEFNDELDSRDKKNLWKEHNDLLVKKSIYYTWVPLFFLPIFIHVRRRVDLIFIGFIPTVVYLSINFNLFQMIIIVFVFLLGYELSRYLKKY